MMIVSKFSQEKTTQENRSRVSIVQTLSPGNFLKTAGIA
jgi:hypothetical protein